MRFNNALKLFGAVAFLNHFAANRAGASAYGIPSFRNRNQRQRRRDHRRTRPHGWKGGAR